MGKRIRRDETRKTSVSNSLSSLFIFKYTRMEISNDFYLGARCRNASNKIYVRGTQFPEIISFRLVSKHKKATMCNRPTKLFTPNHKYPRSCSDEQVTFLHLIVLQLDNLLHASLAQEQLLK